MNENYLKALIYSGHAMLDGACARAAIKNRKWGWAAFWTAMSLCAASIAAEAAAKPTLDKIEQASADLWAGKNDEEEVA